MWSVDRAVRKKRQHIPYRMSSLPCWASVPPHSLTKRCSHIFVWYRQNGRQKCNSRMWSPASTHTQNRLSGDVRRAGSILVRVPSSFLIYFVIDFLWNTLRKALSVMYLSCSFLVIRNMNSVPWPLPTRATTIFINLSTCALIAGHVGSSTTNLLLQLGCPNDDCTTLKIVGCFCLNSADFSSFC